MGINEANLGIKDQNNIKNRYLISHGMKEDLIVVGGKWPLTDTEEASRMERYRINNLLFRNRYEDVWQQWHERVTRNWDKEDLRIAFVVSNFCKVLTLLCADLLYGEQGETFGATCTNDKANEGLQKLITDNHFNITAYEVSGIDTSKNGDGVYKLMVEDGQVKIYGQPASNWFPLVERDNIKKIKAHILAWKETYNGNDYVRKEVHEKGRIHNLAYLLSGSDIQRQVKLSELGLSRLVNGEEVEYPEQEDTRLPDDFLIVHNPNWGLTEQIYGVDDYEDVDTLVSELAVMLSRNSMVLAKHTDPNMYGEYTYLEQEALPDGRVEYRLPSGGTFYPVSADGKPPGYLTWDGRLEAAEKHIDRLIESLFYVSETSPAAFGLDKAAVTESGAALKKRLIRTLAKVNRKKIYADPAIKDVLEIAQKLDNEWSSSSYTPERPTIKWEDGLPNDPKEETEIVGMRVNDGTISRLEAIMVLDKCDKETAEKKLEQIQKEQDAALPVFGRSQTIGGGQPPNNPFQQGTGGRGTTGQE
ncbi:MAG: phage portal protein [Firmicutes bacterium]|nr:phage portal protein [Bacillota bacterium]